MTDSEKRGWRYFELVRKQRESETITSCHFAPCDGGPLPAFTPGQFLTFRFPKRDGSGEVLRNYSLSGPPAERRFYRISVKREAAPPGSDVPPGLASCHLHDELQIGHRLLIMEPRGQFTLDEQSSRPVLLLSGGVGSTPLVAMAHRLVEQGTRRTWFIHACENGRVHAFRSEIAELAAGCANFRSYFCYNAPDEEDRLNNAFDGEGLLTAEMLQSFLPIDNYDCYLCGPPGFMQAVYSMLIRLGVPEPQIRYEFFGPSTVLKAQAAPAAPPARATAAQLAEHRAEDPDAGKAPMVTFARSGMSLPWDGSSESILAFAEANGLSPDFSCRAGVCSSCQCVLKSGSVDYFEEPLGELEEGTVLICCSRPAGDVVLDI